MASERIEKDKTSNDLLSRDSGTRLTLNAIHVDVDKYSQNKSDLNDSKSYESFSQVRSSADAFEDEDDVIQGESPRIPVSIDMADCHVSESKLNEITNTVKPAKQKKSESSSFKNKKIPQSEENRPFSGKQNIHAE
jgi:hypothetical protein